MNIYLISNNLVLNDISYETLATVDEKRENRPLSIAGEELSIKLSKKIKVNNLYSSSYASALACSKYIAQENKLIININNNLNDVKIGNMNRHNIKMLRFMQDKNFDYKYPSGESMNEAKHRMTDSMHKIIASSSENTAIITHKRAIMAYLLNFCELGYNLDEHLILSYHGEVILDDAENDIDIVKLEIKEDKIINIMYLEIEG